MVTTEARNDWTLHDIQTPDALQEAYARLMTYPSLALDTEFVRQRTYFPQLALIQIAIPSEVWLLDPLMPGFDWEGLKKLLEGSSALKILHAPHQDLEALESCGISLAGPLWDTQTASMLCGHTQALGYHTLVLEHLGLSLDKGEQRSAWSQRPLTQAQKLYAAQDVAYLHALVEPLHDRLQARDRWAWFQEDMDFLREHPLYGADKVFGLKPEWVQNHGSWHGFYTLVQRLFELREQKARCLNKPREFLWDNKTLMALAGWACRSEDRSTLPPSLPRSLKKFWPEIQGVLQDIPDRFLLHPESFSVPRDSFQTSHRMLFEKLRRWTHHQAEAHTLPTALLATRDELKRFVYGENDVRFLKGWRYPLLGQTAQAWRATWQF